VNFAMSQTIVHVADKVRHTGANASAMSSL
jgi:hypothetical protein